MISHCFYVYFRRACEFSLGKSKTNLDKPFFHGYKVTTGI